MFFYEYEMIIDNLNELVEEENKQNEKYQKEQEQKYKMPSINANTFSKSMPKMPSLSNIKLINKKINIMDEINYIKLQTLVSGPKNS